uniref:Uncharacterized protein n=1 Tax=Anguilla anguilla TaxID=7936 RepID=A0A0E9TAB3_ANGAN
MDCYDTDEQLTDFERGIIVGACLAGTPRAKAIELAKEASRVTPVFKVILAAFESVQISIVTANKVVNTSREGVLIYLVLGCEQDQVTCRDSYVCITGPDCR